MKDRLSGVGLSVAPAEVVRHCGYKIDGLPAPWRQLEYLSIGVASHDPVPESAVAALREAKLSVAVHLLELNLVRPLRTQRDLVVTLLRAAEALEPLCIEEDLGLWSWGTTELEQHMLPPIFDREAADIVAANLRELQASLGVPFYAENPPVYCDLGSLDLLAFMEHVAAGSGCGLVLDIGHLVGYCAITGRDPEEYLGAWSGIGYVRELHIAGFSLRPDVDVPLWLDDHAQPIRDYALDLAALARSRADRELPITLEQEGAVIPLVASHITRVSRRFFS